MDSISREHRQKMCTRIYADENASTFPTLSNLLAPTRILSDAYRLFHRQRAFDVLRKVVTPRSQEFRWSNGGLPQTFDPAFAAAPGH